jgi:hypothetical protein
LPQMEEKGMLSIVCKRIWQEEVGRMDCSKYLLQNACCTHFLLFFRSVSSFDVFKIGVTIFTFKFPLHNFFASGRYVIADLRAVHPSTALCWALAAFQFLNLFTVGRTLGRGMIPPQGRCLYREQHKYRINAHRHPCLELVSNSRPPCSSGRRMFMP